jgi:hypothetical protein
MGGVCSSAVDASPPLSPPHIYPPSAEGHRGAVAANDDDNDNFPSLLDLVERFPDLFEQRVLAHLDPIDRTFLAQTGGAFRAAAAASDMPRAGTREEVLERSVWVVTHKLKEFCKSVERLAWAKASGCPWVAQTSLWADVWRCCGGLGLTAARGMRSLVHALHVTGTWRCCGGRGSKGASGTIGSVTSPPWAGTWRYCGGRGSTAARGISGRVKRLREPGTTRRLTHGCWRNRDSA